MYDNHLGRANMSTCQNYRKFGLCLVILLIKMVIEIALSVFPLFHGCRKKISCFFPHVSFLTFLTARNS